MSPESDAENLYQRSHGLAVYEHAVAAPYFAYLKLALPRLLRKFNIPLGSALEMACGGGRLVDYLAGRGWAAYGCDISAQMIELARQSFPDLQDQFFISDMCELPSDRQYGLITIVFNSIHYLDRRRRAKLYSTLGQVLSPGGYFISQHCPWGAISRYWLNQTHRWESPEGLAFWTAKPTSDEGVVDIDRQYFTKTAESLYELSVTTYPYHFFHVEELSQGLAAQGIELLGTFDGATLAPLSADSNSCWVVARRGPA